MPSTMSTTAPPTDGLASRAAVPTVAPRNTDDATLAYHIVLLLLALSAVFVLARLPRALALFGGASKEWAAGHFFWYDASVTTRRGRRGGANQSRRVVQAMHNAYPPPNTHAYSKEGGDGQTAYNTQRNALPQRLTEKGLPLTLHFPPHVPSCPAPLRPLLAPLRARLPFLSAAGAGAGMGMGQGLILAVYFYAWVYAAFFRSNIFTDSARTGWIAAVQVPIVFALSGKNGVGWVGGWGYEKLNFLHRFVGRMIVLAANIHSMHYFYQWSLNGTFKKSMQNPAHIWGMVALVCVDMIFLFSVQAVRSRAYNLFLITHIIGFILVLPAMYVHKPALLPYILFAVGFFSFDHLLRLVKSRLTTAHLTPLPELEMTRVEIPSLNAGWRAGQHVRIRVCSSSMGWFGWMEVHPFTISNVAKSENGEGMVLMCKRAGGWTRKLYEVAKVGGYTATKERTVEGGSGAGGVVGKEVKIVVEGPYGGPGHVNFASFSAAVYVVGGSGITYAMAAIEDLVKKDLKGQSRVKVIELVWIVADPACLAPLLPIFTTLIHQSVFTPLRISVFYTRAPIGKQPAFFDAVDASPFAVSSSYSSNANPPLATVAEVLPTITTTNNNARSNSTKRPSPISPIASDQHALQYQQREHHQQQNQHEFGSYSRPRPPTSRRPTSPYESPRAAPVPPTPTSASALMQGQMQSQSQPTGPQRQDSNASARTLVNRENSTRSKHTGQSHFPPGLTLAPGRPKLSKFLEHALQRAVTLSHGNFKDDDSSGGGGRLTGMVVGVCGPGGLADDVVAAVGGLDGVRRDQVGGVEVCEEVFGW